MAGSVEDYARGILGGVSGFFGWDTPNDRPVASTGIVGTPPATSASAQPQTVAPTGIGSVTGLVEGIPTWVMIAGGLLAVGVVVVLVSR